MSNQNQRHRYVGNIGSPTRRCVAACCAASEVSKEREHCEAYAYRIIGALDLRGTDKSYLSEIIASARQDARDAALEEACKAQCPNCARGEEPRSIPGHVYHPIPGTGGGGWPQASEPCMAAGIRGLKEKR